jgi:membrane protease YdiL (CAAX protease family)
MSENGDQWQEHAEAVAAEPSAAEPAIPGRLPAVGWGPGFVGVGLVLVVGGLLVGAVPVAIADQAAGRDIAVIVAQFTLVFALIGAAIAVASWKTEGGLTEALRRLGFKRPTGSDFGWMFVALFVYFVLAFALSFVISPDQEDIVDELGADGDSLLLTIVVGVLVIVGASLSEEIFFRGFAFTGLSRAMPIVLAAVISTAVWASLHLGAGDAAVVVQLALFGFVLSALYAHTGTLWMPILAHMINNSLAFALLLST